jgi:hypothetical protein
MSITTIVNRNKKASALGSLIVACNELSLKHGGNQKIQKVLGKKLYYQSPTKAWFYSKNLSKLSIARLDKLTNQIKGS